MTGRQRVHRYEQLLAHLRKWGLTEERFEGYLEAFHYGMPPHGGFGMGAERLLQTIVDAGNLRETTLFPYHQSQSLIHGFLIREHCRH